MFPLEHDSRFSPLESGAAEKLVFVAPEEPTFCYSLAPLAQRFFNSPKVHKTRRKSPKVLDLHSSKTSETSSAPFIPSTFLVYAGDMGTSNAHWKRNFYLGMLTWTRCEIARLLLLEPIFTSAHLPKVWGSCRILETSVKIRDFDGYRFCSTNLISCS